MAILNSLFRRVYKDDLATPTFDGNDDPNKVQALDNTGASVFVTPMLAKDIKVSKDIFNDPDFALIAGDDIEDALKALERLIGEYEYTLPTIYDTNVIGSATTTNYIGLTIDSTQSEITKYLYDLIDAITIPAIPEFDSQIKTVDATNVALNLPDGANVSDGLISLNNSINGLATPKDIVVQIDTITKNAIPTFTGTNQSEMNIFLAENSGGTGGLWEQVAGTNYIKPSILTGQTNPTSIIMENQPIYFRNDINTYISGISSYPGLVSKVNNVRVFISESDSGVSIDSTLDNTYQKGLLMNIGADKTFSSYKLGEEETNLNITKGYNGFDEEIILQLNEDVDILMNYNLSDGSTLRLENSDRISLNFNVSVNNVATTYLRNDSTYLKMGGVYQQVELYKSENQFLQLNGSGPGSAANNKLSFSDSVYMTMESDKIGMYVDTFNYISLNDSLLTLSHDVIQLSAQTVSIGEDFYNFNINVAEDEIKIGYKTGDGSITSSGLIIGNAYIKIDNLPTSDPGVVDTVWNDNGTLKISI